MKNMNGFAIIFRKMLNNALLRHINIETFYWKDAKSYLSSINFFFLFPFWICLTSAPDALFSMTLIFIQNY
jgi:hypothetical protein